MKHILISFLIGCLVVGPLYAFFLYKFMMTQDIGFLGLIGIVFIMHFGKAIMLGKQFSQLNHNLAP